MQPLKAKSQGFTIIETLIYILLLAVIMGGTLAVVFQIMQASGSLQAKTQLEEEGNFLLAKVNWALSSVSAVSTGTNAFSATKFDSSQVTYRLNVTNLESNESGSFLPLNSSDFKVSNLSFNLTANPQGIATSFDLTTADENGKPQTLTFETTKNLRK